MPTLCLDQDVELYYADNHCTDSWQTPPVILLQHGFSRHGGFWYNGVPLLGEAFRILRPDMRGMGKLRFLHCSWLGPIRPRHPWSSNNSWRPTFPPVGWRSILG